MASRYIKAVFNSIVVIILITPAVPGAQVLEEIIVTAQRREQSLQEVPISLETYNGADLIKQGFRVIEDLSTFSPSVEIDINTNQQDVALRGLGTTGNNLGLEQSVPTFVDGVHFGRTSMIMGAFLDLDRIEVLRGPQPIFFGQNATAGAFSLTTKKPGEEWEGDMSAEYGNFGRTSVEGGIGGPITDTLGVRVAGQYDRTSGWMEDIVTGDSFPYERDIAGRVTLQWDPIENFEVTAKMQVQDRLQDGQGNKVCRTTGIIETLRGTAGVNDGLDEQAVIFPGVTSFDNVTDVTPPQTDCENGFNRLGIREATENSFRPVPDIFHADARSGILDIRAIGPTLVPRFEAHDDMKSNDYRLGMIYTLANEGMIDSTSAYVKYRRATMTNNRDSPILSNLQQRGEVFDMWSQELRYSSPRGGTFEWETGLYWQIEDLDLGNPGDPKYATQTIRSNMRTPVRVQTKWQDTQWLSAYASMTFNFMDNKASLDIGGRYTDIKKDSLTEIAGKTWIMNINPIDGLGRADSTQLATGTVRNVAASMINCATGHRNCGSFGTGYWTHLWNLQDIPNVWHTQAPVGVGALLVGDATSGSLGPFTREYKDNNFDPQVVLRYRPVEELSLYGKWATAFKGGGADLGGINVAFVDPDIFQIDAEYAETFEAGAKGSLLDGAASYSITAFRTKVKDLQIATDVPNAQGGGSRSTNAGRQRTQGIELETKWAATDRLTLGFSGALMDGVMLSYEFAGCNEFESANANTGPCLNDAESIALYGTNLFAGTIDRSGSQAPRTPDWKFVLSLDYEHPVYDQYKIMFNGMASISDTFIYDTEAFEEFIKYDSGRTVANLNLGYGPQDDTWALTLWVRNALDEGLMYFPEFDPQPVGKIFKHGISPRNWRTYGVQFNYNYN